VILAVAAALAIVVADHTSLRSGAQSGATELTTLWQGDVLEVRGERAGYLQVYNYRRERGGYLRSESVRPLGLTESDAPQLLAVLRFLREARGSEALGISYGAAYLKAVPSAALTAEPLEAIALMAERLADAASGGTNLATDIGAHLDVASQSGIRMRSFERNGRIHTCYDGELFHRVLTLPRASAEERALAALSLTRSDCIDPALGAAARTALDRERAAMLAGIPEGDLTALTRSRLHARRAAIWASLAFEEARGGEPYGVAGRSAVSELLSVRANDLGEDRVSEYTDAVLRVSASRWARAVASAQLERFTLTVAPGDPGQTCIALHNPQSGARTLVQRCTYGVPWLASAQLIAQGQAVVLAVQPLESWRELWIFHAKGDTWIADVLPPGFDEPEEGYIDYAGYVPATKRLLIVRELKDRGHFRRSFEELRLDDLVTVRQASRPDLLRDFGRWQDVGWRRDTLALH
jgi:hypothetical protein